MINHAHMTAGTHTEGICGFDGEHLREGLGDPPCFAVGEYVLILKQEAECMNCGREHLPVNVICCERHAHLTLERMGSEVKSVLPVHQDADKLKYDIDKELEEMR